MNRRAMKATRKRLGLSQRQLASRLGCSRSHIANIENGHRKPGALKSKIGMYLLHPVTYNLFYGRRVR